MIEELDVNDLDLLSEALVAWEGNYQELAFSMLRMVFSGKEEREQIAQEERDRLPQKQADAKVRNERATLLSAKLLRMRNALSIEELTRGRTDPA